MKPTIDLNRMRIFRQVVLAGSFTKAANLLHQPKSRISRNVAALERELGVQLIYRTTRQFRLTDAGRDLYDRSLVPLNELAQVLETISHTADELSGVLRVTAPEDLGVALLADVCRAFIEVHPKVHIDLHLTGDVLDLVKESIDVAVRVGRLKDSSLLQKKLGQARLGFFVSPTLARRYGIPQKVDDLERMPFLSFSNLQRGRPRLDISNGKNRRAMPTQTVFISNNALILRQMAVQGMGVAFLPLFLARDDLRQGRLLHVCTDWGSEDVPIQVVIPQQKEPLPRVKRFMEFLALQLAPYFV